jgi:hypothetical protein
MGIKRRSGKMAKGKKSTGGMAADLISRSRLRMVGRRGSWEHMPGRQMGRYPLMAANSTVFCLYLHLKYDVWLYLRLEAMEMVLPALRGITMTYIN